MIKMGDRIKKVRFEKNLSQFDFAEILGIHRGHLSKLENDKIDPSPKLLEKIETYFGIDHEWLVDGKGVMESDVQSQYLSKDEIEIYRKKIDRINYSIFSERLKLLSDTIFYHAKIFDSQSMDFVRDCFVIDHNTDEAKNLKDDYKKIKDKFEFLAKTIEQTFRNGNE